MYKIGNYTLGDIVIIIGLLIILACGISVNIGYVGNGSIGLTIVTILAIILIGVGYKIKNNNSKESDK